MKKILLMTMAFCLIAATAYSGDIPSLTGEWVVDSTGSVQGHGMVKSQVVMNITVQNKHVFQGENDYYNKGKKVFINTFKGTVSNDGSIVIGNDGGGTAIGKLLSKDKMILQYVDFGGYGGAASVSFSELTRKK